MNIAFAIALIVVLLLSAQLWRYRLARAREHYIRSFSFPRGLFAKACAKYPGLSQKDMELVSRGLRQFFLAYLKSGRKHVSMPSQIADELWHEFILYTKNYEMFSRKAFGQFLHHTPVSVLSSEVKSNSGLRRCWRLLCIEENINPRKPSRLPLLFALDAKYGIANGYHYVADCNGFRQRRDGNDIVIHCGGDFFDSSLDGGTDGFFDGASGDHHSGSDSDGGGCGGGD